MSFQESASTMPVFEAYLLWLATSADHQPHCYFICCFTRDYCCNCLWSWLWLYCAATRQLQANSAFHPSGVSKCAPALAGKEKAGMVHSVSRWTQCVQVKLWDPWKCVPYLSTLEVCSQRGTIHIHIYLYLYTRRRWTDDIRDWMGLSVAECTKMAQERELWRTMVSLSQVIDLQQWRWSSPVQLQAMLETNTQPGLCRTVS